MRLCNLFSLLLQTEWSRRTSDEVNGWGGGTKELAEVIREILVSLETCREAKTFPEK